MKIHNVFVGIVLVLKNNDLVLTKYSLTHIYQNFEVKDYQFKSNLSFYLCVFV